jgi:cytoskeletal protein CcmA (bactofilin family)
MFKKTSGKPTRPETTAIPIPPLPDLEPLNGASSSSLASQVKRPIPASAPKAPSMLSSDFTYEGNITGGGDLQIDGAVKGDIRVTRLTIGETGTVEGNIKADHIEVRGRVVGSINAKHIKLLSTAYVDGDITHDQLSVDVGAYFQGRALHGRKPEMTVSQPSPAPQPSAAAPQTFTASNGSTTTTSGDSIRIELKPVN